LLPFSTQEDNWTNAQNKDTILLINAQNGETPTPQLNFGRIRCPSRVRVGSGFKYHYYQ
jgi:hypothetical protein